MQLITLRDSITDKFYITTYPDGQRNITLSLSELNVKKPIFINCSIKNFIDLELLFCLICALKRHDFYIQEITFSYLFGMRSDRGFEKGQPNYFRDVIAPIINLLDINKINILEPHSDISFYNIKNSYREKISWDKICNFFGRKWLAIGGDQSFYCNHIIFYNFDKKRNGNEINVTLCEQALKEALSDSKEPLIIMDDLCDAGGTFIAESKYLRENGVVRPLWLYVHHGLFTKGIQPLLEHFDKIICTNSYQDIVHSSFQQIKVI